MSNDTKTMEDVRNLIVCDTQFGWTGSTSLKMQEMLALQERGWVAEGAENLEFDLTEAGREVVARALQSAVQPTLADVQPGGRVRLGDQDLSTSEGARRYVADFFSTKLRRHDFGDYILTELAADFACALAQHLSAQPSPGGQGETLVTDAMVMAALQAVTRETLAGVGDCDSKVIGVLTAYGIDGAVDIPTMVRAMLEAALAARQPVGQEPVAVKVTPEMRASFRRAYREGGFWADRLDTALDAMMRAAPPAQAVDLGELRRLSDSWLARSEKLSVTQQRKAGAYWACAKELRDWLDSQAVGK